MRAKSVLLLMLALGCGLVASIGITQVMSNRSGPKVVAGDMLPIFVVISEVAPGDPLTAEVLKLEEWPKEKVPASAISKMEDIQDRRARTKLYPGVPILEEQLGGSDTIDIPDGFRLVAVKVDPESGSAGLIRPTDRVDVLVHLQANPSRGIMETRTETILQNVKVGAVGKVFRLDDTETGDSSMAKTVSLLVTPSQAEVLMLYTEIGKIRLVLRGNQDNEVADSLGARLHDPGMDQPGGQFALATPADKLEVQPESQDSKQWMITVIEGSRKRDVHMEAPVDAAVGRNGVSRWKTTITSSQASPKSGGIVSDIDRWQEEEEGQEAEAEGPEEQEED